MYAGSDRRGRRDEENVDADFCNIDGIGLWKAAAVFYQGGLGDHQGSFYHRAAASGFDRHGNGGADVHSFDRPGGYRSSVAVCGKGVKEEEKL